MTLESNDAAWLGKCILKTIGQYVAEDDQDNPAMAELWDLYYEVTAFGSWAESRD